VDLQFLEKFAMGPFCHHSKLIGLEKSELPEEIKERRCDFARGEDGGSMLLDRYRKRLGSHRRNEIDRSSRR
jgi:hypothetical protein